MGQNNHGLSPIFHKGLGLTETLRQASYRELFRNELEAGLVNDIRNATNGNFVLGDERFKEQISNTLKRRVTPGKAGRPVGSAPYFANKQKP